METLKTHFVGLARNNRWSNWRLLNACRSLSRQEYEAERPSFFGSIHACLNHILIVDLLYLDRLEGTNRVAPDRDELCGDLASLRREQETADLELIRYCEALDDSTLSAAVRFRRADGTEHRESVHRVLTHLFLHQVHHRGQVHDMLSATSVEPPQLDEFFLAGDLDLRRVELEALGLPVE